MEPELKPTGKFFKKRVVLWIILGLVLFGGANALAFLDGYKRFVSELKIATIKSWDDAAGRDDGFKLAATIALDKKDKDDVKEVVTIPRPKKTFSENFKEVATSIQSLPEKLASIISTSSNLLIPPATSPKTEPTPPPLARQAQNEILEPKTSIKEEPKQLLNPVISVVGGAGRNDTKDFIDLFNPNWERLDISGWQLLKRTKNSTTGESIRKFPSGSIVPAKGNFIWANRDSKVAANTTSTDKLAPDNSIVLLDKSGNIIDSLAWGEGHTNPYIEGSAVPNPEPGILIKRKFNGEVPVDTNDNSQDFLVK